MLICSCLVLALFIIFVRLLLRVDVVYTKPRFTPTTICTQPRFAPTAVYTLVRTDLVSLSLALSESDEHIAHGSGKLLIGRLPSNETNRECSTPM